MGIIYRLEKLFYGYCVLHEFGCKRERIGHPCIYQTEIRRSEDAADVERSRSGEIVVDDGKHIWPLSKVFSQCRGKNMDTGKGSLFTAIKVSDSDLLERRFYFACRTIEPTNETTVRVNGGKDAKRLKEELT